MQYRELGRTGWRISPIGFGAWAMGGDAWGKADDATSLQALHKAVDLGVNFIDTADVYGDGHSEQLIGRLRRERSETLIVATKAGKRLQPQVPSGFNRANLTAYVERSIRNLQAEGLDLLQLHCPPPAVYAMPEVFGILDELVQAGKIRYYGVSVETVAEALAAMENPGVQSVQIIFNLFRPKPAEQVFVTAKAKRVGILARVPLASGLLSGRLGKNSAFPEGDHRNFNRRGEAFDVGETFSGVDFARGLEAVEELRALVPAGATMAQFALRWVLMFPEVTATIPGARTAAQAEDNVRAADLPALTPAVMAQARSVYDRLLRATIHNRW